MIFAAIIAIPPAYVAFYPQLNRSARWQRPRSSGRRPPTPL